MDVSAGMSKMYVLYLYEKHGIPVGMHLYGMPCFIYILRFLPKDASLRDAVFSVCVAFSTERCIPILMIYASKKYIFFHFFSFFCDEEFNRDCN